LLALYSVLLGGLLLVTLPWWLRELRVGGRYREGLWERMGRIPRMRLARLATRKDGEAVVWVHAVSVGEVLAAAPLVARLRADLLAGRVFVSTTTRTGQEIARARFGVENVFYCPADFAFAVRAWLRVLQPSLLVLMESELWPRMLWESARAGVPVAVVNARISDRSWPRYRKLRQLWRPLLETLAVVQAQTEEDARRLRFAGATNAVVGGNLKFDVQPAVGGHLVELLQQHLPAGVAVLVCGSTLAGEEALLLRQLAGQWTEGMIVVLAPRHPERFDEVAELLAGGERGLGRPMQAMQAMQPMQPMQPMAARGLMDQPVLRLSAWRLAPQAIAPGAVLLLDSVGELAGLYGLATVAVVGGGLLHAGGHNPLEPACLGKPVVIGSGAENFLEIVDLLVKAEGLVVVEAEGVGAAVTRLLRDAAGAAAMGRRAAAVCVAQRGATERAIEGLLPLMRRNATRGAR
jgi:3-deoxy-D-manno-octulosonic-acid transferase